MKKIFKYKLHLLDEQEIQIPKWSRPLSVQIQNGEIQMWALVDPNEHIVTAKVTIHGTGEDVPDNFYVGREHNLFLGTVQQGAFVWHVFITGTFTHQS